MSEFSVTRRTFLAGAAGALAASASGGVLRAAGKTYKGCVIGDVKNGGYGHSLHRMWGLRDDIDVVALADPDEEGRAKHAQECGARKTYADYREMLEKEQPDLVAIGPRWTTRHVEYLTACTDAGAHGIMEKPLGVDLAECDAMIAAADAKNLKWSMAFNFRASPVMAELKRQLVEEKFIGDVMEMRSRGKEDHRAGGEDLIVLGIHLFDLMHYFQGPPEWCTGYCLTNGAPSRVTDITEATEPLGPILGDTVHASYTFPKGVQGYFSSMKNAAGNQGRWGLEIYGTKGIATIRMEHIPRVFWIDEPGWEPGRNGKPWKALHEDVPITPGGSPVWHYTPIVDDLVASIETDKRPFVSLHDGRMATEMIQGVWESYMHKRSPKAIPLEIREHPLARWNEAAGA